MKIKLLFILFIINIFNLMNCSKEIKTKGQFKNYILKDLSGNYIDLYKKFKNKKKLIIINIFSTWNKSCNLEIPKFVKLQKKYIDKIIIIGISFDNDLNNQEIKKVLNKKKLNYPIVMGTKELAMHIKLRYIPRTFILTDNFKIIRDFTGGHPDGQFEKILKKYF